MSGFPIVDSVIQRVLSVIRPERSQRSASDRGLNLLFWSFAVCGSKVQAQSSRVLGVVSALDIVRALSSRATKGGRVSPIAELFSSRRRNTRVSEHEFWALT